MKNAEKYAKQIAGVITKAEACPTDDIMDQQNSDGWPECDRCIFTGICTNEDRLKEWLLQEASS